MINAEDPTILDARTSCTRDEAAAKLMGWMRGPIFKQNIPVNEFGNIPRDQMPYLMSLERPLLQLVNDMKDDARRRLIEAAEADANMETLQELADKVHEIQPDLDAVLSFLADIDYEASKVPSVLVIDQRQSAETGEMHFWTASVDEWARKKYNISILHRKVNDAIEPQIPVPQTQPRSNVEVNPPLPVPQSDVVVPDGTGSAGDPIRY